MRFQKEVLKNSRGMITLYLLLGVICAFLANFKANYFQKVIDGLTNRNLTLAMILFYGGVMIIEFLLHYLDNLPETKLQHSIYLDSKLLALKKISTIDYSEYQKLGAGKLIQQVETGAAACKDILFEFWFRLIRELIPTIAFSLFFIWQISRPITFAILAGYGFVFLITNLLLKALYRIKERILTKEEDLNHFLVRGFLEMPIFRMARQFQNEVKKAEAAKDMVVSAKVHMKLIHEAFFTAFALLVALLDTAILLYAWHTQSISVGEVVALLSLLSNAYTPIAIFNVLYIQYKLDQAAYRRFEGFLKKKDDPQLTSGQAMQNCRGEITIKNLCFRYGERLLFDQLNLCIRPGEKVAFVGESGSGKSTLLKIIAGLVKYESGEVKIDGKELKELQLYSLYEHLSYLSQDSTVFDGTLRENIDFDRPAEDREILLAIEKAQLAPLFQTMQGGLETQIGERGTILSGGERQRVAISRLWLEQREITILDEATSALDNLTEKAVMRETIGTLSSKTVIAVAHKLSSIADFDRIIVFQNGRIHAQGSFTELLQTNEYFARLYKSSFK